MESRALEYIFWGWRWQILGAIRAVARAEELGEIFCQVKAKFHYAIWSHRSTS